MSHPPTDSTLSRREFLRAGAAAAVVAAAPGALRAAPTATADACIFLMLTGGPSHLDTFDPKPDAPSDVRGPFRPIRHRVPGLHLSELFPKMAAMADKFALVRSLHHTAPPIHETGFQLLNTGRLFRDGPEWPSVGAVVSHLHGDEDIDSPRRCVAHARVETVINDGRRSGQPRTGRGFRSRHRHCQTTRVGLRLDLDQRYGRRLRPELCRVGRASAQPARSVRHRQHVLHRLRLRRPGTATPTAGRSRTDLDDYRDTVAPTFDTAFTPLLTDLERARPARHARSSSRPASSAARRT